MKASSDGVDSVDLVLGLVNAPYGLHERDPIFVCSQDGTKKQPYYVSLAGAEEKGEDLMYMAGLYDSWTDAEGCKRHTYTILTTDSSKRLQWCACRSFFLSQQLSP